MLNFTKVAVANTPVVETPEERVCRFEEAVASETKQTKAAEKEAIAQREAANGLKLRLQAALEKREQSLSLRKGLEQYNKETEELLAEVLEDLPEGF